MSCIDELRNLRMHYRYCLKDPLLYFTECLLKLLWWVHGA